MATQRTGRPRGRPRKAKPPPRRYGRPDYDFLTDPDRYDVALLDAMIALEIGSERACAMGIAALEVGWPGRPPEHSAKYVGLIVTNWRGGTKPGVTKPTTLAGRVATLRDKRRKTTSDPAKPEGRWRRVMAWCFKAALATSTPDIAKAQIAHWAELIGEGDFARKVLFAMVDAKFALPD